MNQDLISRQAILKHIEKKRQDALMIDDLRESNIIMMGMKLLEEAVRIQPSAQPEIIRCKDCKWCEDADGLMCKNPASWVVATDYDFGCVYAERRQQDVC